MVHTTDSLGKDGADINDLELGAQATVLGLRNGIRNKDLVNGRSVDASNRITAENTVGEKSVDLGSTFALQELGSTGKGVASV